MKGILCYYSGTGNTRLACEKIARQLKSIDLTLYDITKGEPLDLKEYKIVGFASFADFGGPPQRMKTFVEQLEPTTQYAFLFNTYGLFSGKTLPLLAQWVQKKGFTVLAGHSLHAPENFPPMISIGLKNEQAPNKKELSDFESYITTLDSMISAIKKKKPFQSEPIKIGFFSRLLPASPREKARQDMGAKFVDKALCVKCGKCKKVCPYHAIALSPYPEFDMEKCYGCWACYHHCPKQAIFTNKFKKRCYYPKPIKQYCDKMI